MFRYAQIIKYDDGYGYIISDTMCSSPVVKNDMIYIPDDMSLDNKRWNYNLHTWENYIPEPQPEPEPQPLSEQEQIAIDTALNTEYIACLLEAQLAI